MNNAEQRWADRLEWENEPHNEECTCKACHREHIFKNQVALNYIAYPNDYTCCVQEFEDRIQNGEACKKHPLRYVEDGNCDGCQEQKSSQKE